MNFKVKGKSWAGNIYHQFESICQDVDEFMSKDTVKFVENQVQSVGMNMKKLYSEVEDIILPLSEEIVGPQTQPEDNKQGELNEREMSSRNSEESFPIEQLTKPPNEENPFQEAKINQSLNGNISEEKITCEGLIKEERMAFDHHKSWKDFSDDDECLSNNSNSGWLFESELTFSDDPNSDENLSLSTQAVSSDDKVNEDNGSSLDPQIPSQGEKDCNFGDEFSNKDESFDGVKSVPSSEVLFSYFSCNEGGDDEEEEKQKDEKTDISSTCSTSPKCSDLLEPTNLAYETKIAFLDPAFSIFASKGPSSPTPTLSSDKNVFLADGSDSVVSSSESRHEQKYKDTELQVGIVPFETGNIFESGSALSDLILETVDLSDVKHDDKSVIMNCNFDRAASHRKNFRYYKKLIQDAFSSRKRLSKEYEHLAILYGDIDAESRQHFRPSSVPSSSNKYVFQETSENEWELL